MGSRISRGHRRPFKGQGSAHRVGIQITRYIPEGKDVEPRIHVKGLTYNFKSATLIGQSLTLLATYRLEGTKDAKGK